MINITFDFNKLNEWNLTPNEFTKLTLIYRGVKDIDILIPIDMRKLHDLGYIKLHPDTNEIQLLSKFKAKIEAFESKFKVEDWIEEWFNLWPEGVKTMGKPVKGALDDCKKKLSRFILKNPSIDKSQILEATRAYIAERSKDQYRGIMCANYFIEKNGISTLEDYIRMLAKRGEKHESFQKKGI